MNHQKSRIEQHIEGIDKKWRTLNEETEEFEHNVTINHTKWGVIIKYLETVMLKESIILPSDFKWISGDIGKILSHFEQVKSTFSKMERHISEKNVIEIMKIHEELYEILSSERVAFSYLDQMTEALMSTNFQEALLKNSDPAFIGFSDEQVAWYY